MCPNLAGSYLDLIATFEQMGFHFDHAANAAGSTRGYADEAVLDVTVGTRTTVSLLISMGGSQHMAVSSAVLLATLATSTRVAFTDWLLWRLRTRGLNGPWRATRHFGSTKVSADYFCADALLVTIESHAGSGSRTAPISGARPFKHRA